MANNFQTIEIRRSNSANAPTTLANGELGFSYPSNTLFIGDTAGGVITIIANTLAPQVAAAYAQANAAFTQGNAAATNVASNGTVSTVGANNINFNNTATVNVSTTANGAAYANVAFSVNASAITNVISLNVSTSIVAANATVNAVSFIPSWTNITCNNSGTPNAWTATSTGYDVAGFWTDPFGIVHLRGLIANTANVTLASIKAFGCNIANGFPVPTSNVVLGLVCANVTSLAGGNVVVGQFTIFVNGAMQLINVAAPVAGTTTNIANISLYGMTYSTH